MRKRIAAFIGEVGREFQKGVVKSLRAEAKKRNYDLIVFANFGSYTSTILYDSGERDIMNLPILDEYEGIILLPDTFDVEGMEMMLLKKLKEESTCPVVSIRNGSTSTYRILIDNYQTTYDLTNHFINNHGYTRICYMSGPFTADDALERLRGFKDAMKDNGLIVNSSIVFEGDFWTYKCVEATEFFLKAYKGNCEAILFANDYMALGVADELRKRGYRIPEDIAICGFDEALESRSYTPALTTVSMPVDEMARQAMEIIDDVNAGIERERDVYLNGCIHYRGSCGCEDKPEEKTLMLSSQVTQDYFSIRMASQIISDVQNFITEEEKLFLINDYFLRLRIKNVYLCLCTDDYKDDNPYSDTMILRATFPLNAARGEFKLGEKKFSRRLVLPAVYDISEPVCLVVHPIHHKNTTFGYLVTQLQGDEEISSFCNPFTSALSIAYEDLRVQKQFSEFVEIKRQSLIDPLTGLYNRRGFEQNLAAIAKSKTINNELITYISADMDNLKCINDNFGHYEGDLALKVVSQILSACCDEDDICARVGGDEFYVIISSPDIKVHEAFISKVYEAVDKKNSELGKEYPLHISIGSYSPNIEGAKDPKECLNIADSRMYDAKKKYKKTLNL